MTSRRVRNGCSAALPRGHGSVTSSKSDRKFKEEWTMWGGPPGLRRTPASGVSRVMAEPDQGVRRGRGRPPYGTLLKKEP
jgi:hypothetical protein